MSKTPEQQRREKQVNIALTAIRKQVRACGESTTYLELYNQAQRLQHMAFSLKDMAMHGGTWVERCDDFDDNQAVVL